MSASVAASDLDNLVTGPSSPISQVSSRGEAHLELNAFRRKQDCALVLSGDSLEVRPAAPGLRLAAITPSGCFRESLLLFKVLLSRQS